MSGSLDYNLTEMMICTAARLFRDETTCFIGTGIPMLAASLAQRVHTPNIMPIFEFGGMGAILEDLPRAVGEARTFHKALSASGICDIMETAQRGFVDYGFLGGAQIDPYGNLNSTIIGAQHHRAVAEATTSVPYAGRPSPSCATTGVALCRRWILSRRPATWMAPAGASGLVCRAAAARFTWSVRWR